MTKHAKHTESVRAYGPNRKRCVSSSQLLKQQLLLVVRREPTGAHDWNMHAWLESSYNTIQELA